MEWSIDFINSIENKHMLNTTTHNIDGKEIKEYLGVVNGDTISELHFMSSMEEAIREGFGGSQYQQVFSEARNIAFERMNQKAMEMGANGVVGIDLDCGVLGNSEIIMISVNGTAVNF